MYLSDQQMKVVEHGLAGSQDPSWRQVEMPVGRQSLPPWVCGLHVEYLDFQFGNDPAYMVKATEDLRNWPDQRWRRDGDMFITEHPDGRAEIYYQSGPIKLEKLQRWRCLDGSLHKYRPQKPNRGGVIVMDKTYLEEDRWEPGEWVEVERLCTRQEQGFGGAHIDMKMIDGTEVTLRGPWHGGAPAGYIEVTQWLKRSEAWYRCDRHRPWHKRIGGTGGVYLREEVFIPILARYAPHLQLARVHNGHRERLQAYLAEWGEPKAWAMARHRYARAKERWEATEPAKRPPHVMCGWFDHCGGKPDCAVGNRCTPKKAA